MEETILTTCKRNISEIEPDNHDFDLEILDYINSIFRILNRYGIGKESFINFYGKSVNSKNIDFYTRNFDWTYKAPNGYTYIIPLNDVRNCSLK